MDLPIDGHTTVRDVVVKHPAMRKVLESYGIDYCCGGGKTLTVAAAEAGVELQDVVEAMRQAGSTPATPEPGGEGSWLYDHRIRLDPGVTRSLRSPTRPWRLRPRRSSGATLR